MYTKSHFVSTNSTSEKKIFVKSKYSSDGDIWSFTTFTINTINILVFYPDFEETMCVASVLLWVKEALLRSSAIVGGLSISLHILLNIMYLLVIRWCWFAKHDVGIQWERINLKYLVACVAGVTISIAASLKFHSYLSLTFAWHWVLC